MSDYLDPNNEELLQDFFAEAESQIDLLERNILVLENDTNNRDAVDEVFRAAHTLKGASATVRMNELTDFTHVVEDVFDEVRESRSEVTAELIDLLLAAVDIIKGMIAARTEGSVYGTDISAVVGGLESAIGGIDRPGKGSDPAGAARSGRQAAPVTSAAVDSQGGAVLPAASAPGIDSADLAEMKDIAEGRPVYRAKVRFDESNPMNTVGAIQVFAAFKSVGTVLRTVPEFERLYDDVFHEVVEYYVASDEAPAVIQEHVTISDVTLSIELSDIDSESTQEASSLTATAKSPQRDTAASREAPSRSDASAASEGTASEGTASQGAGGLDEADEGAVEEGLPEAAARSRRSTPTSSVLRVDSRRIDNLLNMVSETVINKASFTQVAADFAETSAVLQQSDDRFRARMKTLIDALPSYLERMEAGATAKEIQREIQMAHGDLYELFDEFGALFRQSVASFRGTAQNLGRITGELQEAVMRIRMVPVSQIFSRFPRLVRDLTRTLNKNVVLEIEGEDTELDKSVIEDLLDPLIHCVRNSIDHGLEPPDERESLGKDPEGHLVLRAASEGNMIIIEVADDGRGIDVEAVRTKAIERGVIHPSKVLSDAEAYNLIFDAGFSTAQEITNISGRGVGLDVVRKQIEKLNGTVTVWSEPGEGTCFTVKIPLTLAIIQGLMVRVGRETYAIPITAVVDSHRIRPDEIRMLDNYEVFSVRDDVVSLLRLSRIFRIDTDENPEYCFVVVVGSGEKKVGLVVDTLIGEEDVVIKPLRDKYTNAPGIAGANITGDGKVSLIIDVAELVELGLKHERDVRRRETVITS